MSEQTKKDLQMFFHIALQTELGLSDDELYFNEIVVVTENKFLYRTENAQCENDMISSWMITDSGLLKKLGANY